MAITTTATLLSDDVYKNYETAKQQFDASLKDDAANDALRAAEQVLAVELIGFAKRMILAKFGQSINMMDKDGIIQDAGMLLWQILARPKSVGNGNGKYTGKNKQGKYCAFSSWCWKVVDSFVLARIRQLERIESLPEGFDVAYDPAPDECINRQQCLSVLTERERKLFDMKAGGWTIPEIAAALNVSESTVDYQWKKVKAKLRFGLFL